MNVLSIVESHQFAIETQTQTRSVRIAAAWEILSVNSRRSYQGAWDRCGQWMKEKGLSLEDLFDEVMVFYQLI